MNNKKPRLRLAILVSHPIQYYSPWFAYITDFIDLHVFYAYQQTPEGQSEAGFSTKFDWDIPLLAGYKSTFLTNISRNPSLKTFFGCNTPEIHEHLCSGDYDALLIFGWNKFSYLQGWITALFTNTPVFIRLDSQLQSKRSIVKRLFKRLLYTLILPGAAYYFSPGVRSDSYLRHYGVANKRIYRLPHMVDVNRFADGAQSAISTGMAAELRSSHSPSANDFIFLFVGKLIPKKRPLLVLEALQILRSEQHITLWIIGDGPLDSEINSMISKNNLNVKRFGFINQSQLPKYYAAADCLILPSDGDETWGLVVNEAQACGLPAIVSNEVGCASELIIEGKTGWILHEPNANHLAYLMSYASKFSYRINRKSILDHAHTCSYGGSKEGFISALCSQLEFPSFS